MIYLLDVGVFLSTDWSNLLSLQCAGRFLLPRMSKRMLRVAIRAKILRENIKKKYIKVLCVAEYVGFCLSVQKIHSG